MRFRHLALAGLVAVFAAGASLADATQDTTSAVVEGQLAPRLQTLGTHAHPITTASARAQLFFNQGLILAYGFNHREAGRSFREVVRLDPGAAMGYWGQALVLGPNINAPMDPAREAEAHALVQKAREHAGGASQREREYIEALARRYTGDAQPDRAALDRAYADAMHELQHAYPDDLDAATLYAEALMDLSPWNYWTADGRPYERTEEILRVLEGVRERDPGHPGANHFYIHATEYARPKLAEPAADALADAVPGAGHLQHMPAHIYARIGRYADASRANEKAIAADEDYVVQCRAQGIYPLAYYPHNIHFLWWTTGLQGRGAESIAAARKVLEQSREHLTVLPPFGKIFPAATHFALVRFGKWDEILAEPLPPEEFATWRGLAHYARGMALARQGKIAEAQAELAALAKIQRDPAVRDELVGATTHGALLELAVAVLNGEIAAEDGRYGEALASLHRAVLLQEILPYNEPPDWYFPVRQSLGAVLLEAGRPAEAEAVYWEDLRKNPENGWSLFGLGKALRAQGKDAQAEAVEARFAKAWEAADVELTASRF